jgi:hypothetical protein
MFSDKQGIHEAIGHDPLPAALPPRVHRWVVHLARLFAGASLVALAACGAGADVTIEENGVVSSPACPVPNVGSSAADLAGVGCPPPDPPPPKCTALTGSLTASPATINAGQSATLQWSVSGTCSASLTVAGQSVGRSGSMTVTPPSSTSYALEAGTRTLATAQVSVLPPACSSGVCSAVTDCEKQCFDNGVSKTCNVWSYENGGDADLDGVPDALENELARRFFPTLRLRATFVNGGLPNGDWGQLYSGGTFPGDWHFVVRKVTPYGDLSRQILNPDTQQYETRGPVYRCGDTECLEIVYVIPYNWDLGDTWASIKAHRGDGEMYSVLVARKDPQVLLDGLDVAPAWDVPWGTAKYDASAWRGFTEFATAHTCTAADSSVYRFRTFRTDVEGVTRLWVSEGKHANYFSQGDCDHGAFYTDSCDDNNFEMVFADQYAGAGPLRNAGEEACHSHATIDHFTAYPGDTSSHPPYADYDVWSDAPFGDDDDGRHLALLRAGTMLWWRGASPFATCWPGASTHPGAPPQPGPVNPCGMNGMCCEFRDDGTCAVCAPADGQCP